MSIRNELDKLRDEVEAIAPPGTRAPAELVVMTDDERARALLALYDRCPELTNRPDSQRDVLFRQTGRVALLEAIRARLQGPRLLVLEADNPLLVDVPLLLDKDEV